MNKLRSEPFEELAVAFDELGTSIAEASGSIVLMDAILTELNNAINKHWYTRFWWKVCGWWVDLIEIIKFYVDIRRT